MCADKVAKQPHGRGRKVTCVQHCRLRSSSSSTAVLCCPHLLPIRLVHHLPPGSLHLLPLISGGQADDLQHQQQQQTVVSAPAQLHSLRHRLACQEAQVCESAVPQVRESTRQQVRESTRQHVCEGARGAQQGASSASCRGYLWAHVVQRAHAALAALEHGVDGQAEVPELEAPVTGESGKHTSVLLHGHATKPRPKRFAAASSRRQAGRPVCMHACTGTGRATHPSFVKKMFSGLMSLW